MPPNTILLYSHAMQTKRRSIAYPEHEPDEECAASTQLRHPGQQMLAIASHNNLVPLSCRARANAENTKECISPEFV